MIGIQLMVWDQIGSANTTVIGLVSLHFLYSLTVANFAGFGSYEI